MSMEVTFFGHIKENKKVKPDIMDKKISKGGITYVQSISQQRCIQYATDLTTAIQIITQ